MQWYTIIVLAMLVWVQADASGRPSEDHELTCYADIDGFPKISSTTSLNAETVLASVDAEGNVSFVGKGFPLETTKAIDCSEDSFGKLSLGSMKELFQIVNLKPKDSFVDLGSGLGEVPITAAVLSGVQKATGVELSWERHKSACKSLAKLESEIQGDSKSTSMVELMQGDMMNVDLSDDTVVFTNSRCFRKQLLDKLVQKFATELPKGARIASTKPFSDLPTRLAQVSVAPLAIGDGISVSVYKVVGARPPKGQKRRAVRAPKKQKKKAAAKKVVKKKLAPQAARKFPLLSRASQLR